MVHYSCLCRVVKGEHSMKGLQVRNSRLKGDAEGAHEVVDNSKEGDGQGDEPHKQGCMARCEKHDSVMGHE